MSPSSPLSSMAPEGGTHSLTRVRNTMEFERLQQFPRSPKKSSSSVPLGHPGILLSSPTKGEMPTPRSEGQEFFPPPRSHPVLWLHMPSTQWSLLNVCIQPESSSQFPPGRSFRCLKFTMSKIKLLIYPFKQKNCMQGSGF